MGNLLSDSTFSSISHALEVVVICWADTWPINTSQYETLPRGGTFWEIIRFLSKFIRLYFVTRITEERVSHIFFRVYVKVLFIFHVSSGEKVLFVPCGVKLHVLDFKISHSEH